MESSDVFLVVSAKAIFATVALAIAAVTAALIHRLIPEGELKTFLFRVRDLDHPTPEHEKTLVRLIVVFLLAVLYLGIAWAFDGF